MIQIFNGRTRGLGQDAQQSVYLQVSVQMRQHLHHFKGARLGVFLAIALHSNADGWAWPSMAVLKAETGYNVQTISQALRALCAHDRRPACAAGRAGSGDGRHVCDQSLPAVSVRRGCGVLRRGDGRSAGRAAAGCAADGGTAGGATVDGFSVDGCAGYGPTVDGKGA